MAKARQPFLSQFNGSVTTGRSQYARRGTTSPRHGHSTIHIVAGNKGIGRERCGCGCNASGRLVGYCCRSLGFCLGRGYGLLCFFFFVLGGGFLVLLLLADNVFRLGFLLFFRRWRRQDTKRKRRGSTGTSQDSRRRTPARKKEKVATTIPGAYEEFGMFTTRNTPKKASPSLVRFQPRRKTNWNSGYFFRLSIPMAVLL